MTTISLLDRDTNTTYVIGIKESLTHKDIDLIKLDTNELWEQVVEETIDYMDIYDCTVKAITQNGFKVIPVSSYQIDI